MPDSFAQYPAPSHGISVFLTTSSSHLLSWDSVAEPEIQAWAWELQSPAVYSVAHPREMWRGDIPMPEIRDLSNIYIGGEDSTSQVMTSVEAAEYLKMHVKTVCRLAKEGKIPAKKVGSEWRFLRSVLDSWLSEALV